MACEHVDQIKEDLQPNTEGCEACLRDGNWWVRLRMCLVCGHVGCCDSSPNRHARRHFEETSHPVIRSFEPNQEGMRWCFIDETPV
ncbi:MAG TPA: UBP-type zinc finger domain-containing protein [Anaerolineales bacterium]|nr:UBP-type zinc finger domain-containing protein [Anaerolineales bacterium]